MEEQKIIYESWDIECLKIYREIHKNPRLTYDIALKIFNKNIKPKGYKLLKSNFSLSKYPPFRVSKSIFIRSF